jgi:hypothetical protein
VKVERRNQGYHGLGNAEGDNREVGLGEGREIGQSVDPAANLLQDIQGRPRAPGFASLTLERPRKRQQ